jgi:acylglycerol lipase
MVMSKLNLINNRFKVPVLLIHGKEDKVSHHINSIDFYRIIKSKDKTLKIF